jgi:hypothetical protein
MPNQFYKGRTNNHLTWVMVDATDFATPESAMSAATKIKIWGKLRGQAAANFVSSGTGSLTNDIQHVGPSVLGVYSIGLVKADLSDASAAWYDQYVVVLSATGAAQQVLVVDGGIDLSAVSGFQSRLSDIASAITLVQSMASDAASAAQQANSRVLLVLSLASDIDSALTSRFSDLHSFISTTGVQLNASSLSDIRSAIAAGPAATVTASDISDIASAVWANTIGARVDSRILVNKSVISDIYSLLSNVNSLAVGSPTGSDIASKVWADTAGAAVKSQVLVILSQVSDIRSHVSDLQSDFQSRVPKRVATDSQLSDALSDIKSAIAGVTATVSASDMSDIASRVDVLLASRLSDILSAAVQTNSRVLVVQSMVSDTQSKLSDVESNLLSVLGTTGVQLNASTLSDIRSAVNAVTVNLTASDISDIASAVLAGAGATVISASDMSDIASRVWAMAAATALTSRVALITSTASDAASAAQQANSRVLVVQSMVSDTQSKLSDVESNLLSVLGTTGVQLNASSLSDLRSAITAGGGGGTGVTASDISDIASAVRATLASDLSDILSAATQINSRALVAKSSLSDIQSAIAVIPATKLAAHAAGVLAAVIGTGSTTTTVKLSTVEGGAPSSVNDFYNGRALVFTSGALAGQATTISDYDGASTTLTVVAVTGSAVNGVTAVIV